MFVFGSWTRWRICCGGLDGGLSLDEEREVNVICSGQIFKDVTVHATVPSDASISGSSGGNVSANFPLSHLEKCIQKKADQNWQSQVNGVTLAVAVCCLEEPGPSGLHMVVAQSQSSLDSDKDWEWIADTMVH